MCKCESRWDQIIVFWIIIIIKLKLTIQYILILTILYTYCLALFNTKNIIMIEHWGNFLCENSFGIKILILTSDK